MIVSGDLFITQVWSLLCTTSEKVDVRETMWSHLFISINLSKHPKTVNLAHFAFDFWTWRHARLRDIGGPKCNYGRKRCIFLFVSLIQVGSSCFTHYQYCRNVFKKSTSMDYWILWFAFVLLHHLLWPQPISPLLPILCIFREGQ
jgi:hypothetical protein